MVFNPADRTIGEHETMNMEVAARWFNAQGCNTNKDILSYHALNGHFHTFLLNKVRVVTYVGAERVLAQKPSWLYSAGGAHGLPPGYMPVKQAAKQYGLEVDEILGAFSVKRINMSTTEQERCAVSRLDVIELAKRKEYREQQTQLRATRAKGVWKMETRKTPAARKAPQTGYLGRKEIAKQFEVKDGRLLSLITRDEPLIPGIIHGKGAGTSYWFSPVDIKRLLEDVPGLSNYLRGKHRVETAEKALREYYERQGLEVVKDEREKGVFYLLKKKDEEPAPAEVSTPPAPPAPAKEPAKVEIKTSTKVTKASFVIYVNVGEGIEVEPTQELVNELLAAGAFRWVGDRLVANLTYVER